ncbi:MAG: hydrophobe/amphiphile efflux-3 (HAE3) family transporter, partial [Dehalococcoidia bacterium]
MTRLSNAIGRFIRRWPWLIIIVVIAISAAAVPGITRLEQDTGFDAFISPDDPIAQANSRYQAEFGGESIVVLITGQVDDVFTNDNLAVLADFEQFILLDSRYKSVFGPVSVLNAAWQEINRGQPVGPVPLDNPDFIISVLYDETGEISSAMRPFVPDDNHLLINITPLGNIDDDAALQLSTDIETFFNLNNLNLAETTVISGAKVVNAISTSMGSNMSYLLALSVIVMILVLALLFRVRWRLLSLFMVCISALWTFGIMGYFSIPLTMATMAVLPILIGLGIDFSIQFHNRYQEEILRTDSVGEAVVISVTHMLPIVGIALLATIIGFITLYISKVPMIRDFGVVLAIGIVFSYIVALLLLHSVVYLADRNAPVKKLKVASREASGRIERILEKIGNLAVKNTVWIFIIAVIFAVAGGVVDHWLPVNTDYEELMPQDTTELMETTQLREIVGTGETIEFIIESEDVTSAESLSWQKDFLNEMINLHPEILAEESLASVVSDASGGVIPPQNQIDVILSGIPPEQLAQFLSDDGKMTRISVNIPYVSLQEILALIQAIQAEAGPPPGTALSPVGSVALGANIMDAVVGSRLNLNLICLGAVLVVLLLVYRRLGITIFTFLPVGAVIAWSSLDMYLIGIPLNPLTAILGVLIIGICTEFMVLLMGRYDEEKKRGLSPRDAMVTALAKIGRAIVTTAITTLGGFGVLIASNFVMIRDFGIATVVGVFLCMVITMTVMPGLIVRYEEWR